MSRERHIRLYYMNSTRSRYLVIFLDLYSLPRVPCVLVLLIYVPPEKAGGKFINRDAGYTAEYLQDIRCQQRPLTFSNFIGVNFPIAIQIVLGILMAQSSYYSYSPLDGPDTIRLLMIEMADDKIPGQIKCRLEHFNISKAPSYTALSYVWGNGSHKFRIHLDGQVCDVGQNLFQALWHLRDYVGEPSNKAPPVSSKRETTWIWIDALCIDQRNILERNHQVRLMGRIYETAVKVVIWLGWTDSESDKKSQGAMSYLMQMRKETTENMLHGGIEIELNERREYFAVHLGRQKAMYLRRETAMRIARHLYRCDLSKFVELCNLSYWYRMWIVQEMGLAKKITILLGRRAVPWSCLGFLRKFLDYKEFTYSLPLAKRQSYTSSCEKIRTSQAFRLMDFQASKKRKSLAALIEACEDSLCSDPRDKVYALLGLATNPQKDELPIDYSKTLFEVYADTVIFQYRVSNGHQGCPSKKIVRFSQILQRSFNRFSELRDKADLYNSQRCKVQDGKDLIHIYGVCAGTINDLGNPISATPALVDKARALPQFNSSIPHESPQVLEVRKKVASINSNVSFALKG